MDWTWLLPLYRGVFLSISRLAFFAFSSCLIARSFFESPNQACLPARTSGVNHRALDRKSTRLNSSHDQISYAVFCLKKKKRKIEQLTAQPVTVLVRQTQREDHSGLP